MIGKTNAKSKAKLQSGKSINAGLNPKVIYADSGYDGLKDLTINAIGLDNLTIALDFSRGNQTVSTRDGYYANTIIVTKPENFLASNIKKGEVIAGITGTYEGSFKPEQSKTVEFNPGSANNITIVPDDGYVLNGVEVGKPVTMIPENIKSGIDIGGVIGTYEASGGGGSSEDRLKKFLDTTKSAKYLFSAYTGTSVDDIIQPNDTENVTTMYYMFDNCNNLTSIPQFNTSKVTTMQGMFRSCTNLTTIPQLNTSNVTNMQNMFSSCTNLTAVPVLDTSNVATMMNMFYDCTALTTIPQLNTSNATNMSNMFSGCTNLTTIPTLDVGKVTNLGGIFSACSKLKSILMTNIGVALDIHFSTKFEREDLLVILNNLKTVTSSKKLTMGSTNLAKLTNEDKAIATNKG